MAGTPPAGAVARSPPAAGWATAAGLVLANPAAARSGRVGVAHTSIAPGWAGTVVQEVLSAGPAAGRPTGLAAVVVSLVFSIVRERHLAAI